MRRLIVMLVLAVLCSGYTVAQGVGDVPVIRMDDDADFLVQNLSILDTTPEFPGGYDSLITYMVRNINYPDEAKEANIEGRVFVTFVVEKDGTIAKARLLRDIGGGCGQEVLRIVNAMPKWKPGIKNGKPVRVQFNLPVSFGLQDEDKE